MNEARSVWRRWVTVWLAVGVVLRALLIVFPRSPDDDTDAYLELGQNLFHKFIYGMTDDGVTSPSLFRLPGYPVFLALLGGHIWLVLVVQSVVDLAGCYLLALFLRRYWSDRAGLTVLALGATCFFTAVYAACALTESLSIFAVMAGIYCLGEVLGDDGAFAVTGWFRRLVPLAGAAALGMVLRPDGALLTFAIGLALVVYGVRRGGAVGGVRTAALFGVLACLPLVPWTIRNAVTFGVFQPLAPRHVNDPGERVNLGFYRWLRTWSVDFETTGLVFWKVGTEAIDVGDMPARAFDSPAQRAETVALIDAYNVKKNLDQALDDRFGALAEVRVRAHPLRYYVWVPALRVMDMWLRPRTEGMDVNVSWWRWRERRRDSAIAVGLGLLNLFYVLAAVGGAMRRPPLGVFLGVFVGMRCLLLATMENSEPRYTLEAFPVVLVLAAIFLCRRAGGSSAGQAR
jgi:hypothetical protein